MPSQAGIHTRNTVATAALASDQPLLGFLGSLVEGVCQSSIPCLPPEPAQVRCMNK